MDISIPRPARDHVQHMSTSAAIRTSTATRHLTLVGAPRVRVAADDVDRDAAIDRVRRARRHVEARTPATRPRALDLERFAYLTRTYD